MDEAHWDAVNNSIKFSFVAHLGLALKELFETFRVFCCQSKLQFTTNYIYTVLKFKTEKLLTLQDALQGKIVHIS